MYVNCGVSSGVCFSAASVLPSGASGAELARLLLEIAGAGFGLYLVAGLLLLFYGAVVRHRRPRQPRPAPHAVPDGVTGATAVRRGASC
ncbi:hypothetical protein ACIRBX_28225 [Kitasatospora sp. NPDC096147]|uniref:hypothetical protein n=1 Tax=Kitasatospora sp. NPDC096147 TaxID=3364093 RepID=UPI003802475B